MNKKLMYIFAIFIVAAITCISQPKKTTLRDKAMVNYAFDYLSSPGSLPFTTAATELSAIHGHSTSQYRLGRKSIFMVSDGKPLDYTQARYWYEQSAKPRKIHARKVNWGGSTSKVWGSNPTPVKQFSGIRKQLNKGMLMLNILFPV